MIFVGLDDTDVIDSPGTNQLALHLAELLAAEFHVMRITRHQLLDDPRVPYTSRNGSALLILQPLDESRGPPRLAELWEPLRSAILAWAPPGSDPGLCLASHVPTAIAEFGRRCQESLVSQEEALELANQEGIQLEGLGGTRDGLIGALAAVGLAATADDGRVIHLGSSVTSLSCVQGCQDVEELRQYGIDEITRLFDGVSIVGGTVDVGRKLRPNIRRGRTVLFVEPIEQPERTSTRVYRAIKVL